MKAMILKQFGGVENFALEEIPKPQVTNGEVLVRVKAIGIDSIDIKSRKGEGLTKYLEKQNPMILGWDISGVITEVDTGVTNFKVGDEVFGTINFPGPGSSYAEFAKAPAGQLARKPESVSHAEAVAATQSPLTAWQALIDNGHIKKGDKVLIHGGAGGVGNYAIQIAKHIGCYVITTISSEDADFVKSIGADEVIDYKTQKFEKIVNNVDFILDSIGGENFVRSLKVLKPEGTIILLPSNKKQEAEEEAQKQHIKNYKHLLMHSDGMEMNQIADMLADGTLKVYINKTFPFEQIPEAHIAMETGKAKGKIVITVD
jgi:NADPH:quinone reductase-like Zn-dependent oxidoreductase